MAPPSASRPPNGEPAPPRPPDGEPAPPSPPSPKAPESAIAARRPAREGLVTYWVSVKVAVDRALLPVHRDGDAANRGLEQRLEGRVDDGEHHREETLRPCPAEALLHRLAHPLQTPVEVQARAAEGVDEHRPLRTRERSGKPRGDRAEPRVEAEAPSEQRRQSTVPAERRRPRAASRARPASRT